MTPELKKQILDLINQEFQRNYNSGIPQIAPHTHNGVDNLSVDAVLSITAGTGITISPNGSTKGDITISTSGGGGGSPGGNNKDVQFNDSSTFGGNDKFTFDKSTNILQLDDSSATGSTGGSSVSGGTSALNLITSDRSSASSYSGGINMVAGHNTGGYGIGGSILIKSGYTTDSQGQPGNISLTAGNGSNQFFNGGSIFVTAGNNSATGGYGGNVTIKTGTGASGYGGSMQFTVQKGTSSVPGNMKFTINKASANAKGFFQFNHFDVYGTIQPNIFIGTASATFGGGQGVIVIRNRGTAPSSNVTNAGILYVEAGALTFRGSGGTVTTIAPA